MKARSLQAGAFVLLFTRLLKEPDLFCCRFNFQIHLATTWLINTYPMLNRSFILIQ